MAAQLLRKSIRQQRDQASYLFKYFLLANFLQYLEAGAVPALLLSLSDDFDMGHGQQGLLGGVVYIALSCGGPFAGYLLRKNENDHRKVIGTAILMNNCFTLLWALTPVKYFFSKALFISLRFLMGCAQCFLCVFLPLWINEFAPNNKRTSWMGYLQASVPLGVMSGYVLASIVIAISHGSNTCFYINCWRIPFLIEVILLLPFCVAFNFIPRQHLSLTIASSKRHVINHNNNNNYFVTELDTLTYIDSVKQQHTSNQSIDVNTNYDNTFLPTSISSNTNNSNSNSNSSNKNSIMTNSLLSHMSPTPCKTILNTAASPSIETNTSYHKLANKDINTTALSPLSSNMMNYNSLVSYENNESNNLCVSMTNPLQRTVENEDMTHCLYDSYLTDDYNEYDKDNDKLKGNVRQQQHLLRQQAISASLYNVNSSTDMMRKSTDKVARLGE